jgi:phosphocarrier protein HPr
MTMVTAAITNPPEDMGTLNTVCVTIANASGLHARPAMEFVRVASGFRSNVKIYKLDECVDGKSIMQLMLLAAVAGTSLTIVAEGEDAPEAIEALARLVRDKFGE